MNDSYFFVGARQNQKPGFPKGPDFGGLTKGRREGGVKCQLVPSPDRWGWRLSCPLGPTDFSEGRKQ